MKAFWRAFHSGIRAPRLDCVAISFLGVIGLLALSESLLRGGALAWFPQSFVLASADDQFGHISHEIAALKANPKEFPIYFFGGSSVRECLSDASQFAEVLSRRTGVRTRLHHFFSTQQTFGETLALVEKLPPGGLVLIGVNPSRFSRGTDDYAAQPNGERFLVSSRIPEEVEVKRRFLQGTALLAFSKMARKWVRTRLPALKHGRLEPLAFSPHFYNEKTRLDDEGKEWFFDTFVKARMLPRFERNFEMNQKVLESVIALAKERGLEVRLLELPMVPLTRQRFSSISGRYERDLRKISERTATPYWEYASDLVFQNEDFNDLFHLLASGRKKYEAPLLTLISQVIAGGES